MTHYFETDYGTIMLTYSRNSLYMLCTWGYTLGQDKHNILPYEHGSKVNIFPSVCVFTIGITSSKTIYNAVHVLMVAA